MNTFCAGAARSLVSLAVVLGFLAVVAYPTRDANAAIPPIPRICVPLDCAAASPCVFFFPNCAGRLCVNDANKTGCLQCGCLRDNFFQTCYCY
jgi:hypothetical protein